MSIGNGTRPSLEEDENGKSELSELVRVEKELYGKVVQEYLQKFKKKEITGEEVMIQLSNDVNTRNDRLRKIYKWNYE
jgi:hypothetical protein